MILRGIWELFSSYGFRSVELEIYVGTFDMSHYRGQATIYPGNLADDVTLGSGAEIFRDASFSAE